MNGDPHTPDLFGTPEPQGVPGTSPPPPAPSLPGDAHALLALLAQWTERGWLRSLDRALVRFCHEQCPQASPLALLLVALTSHQVGRGHVCLDLADLQAQPERVLSLPPDELSPDETPPTPADLLHGLQVQDCTRALNESGLLGSSGADQGPLVLDDGANGTPLLYLRRYWQYERQIESALQQRLDRPVPVDDQVLSEGLAALFGPPPEADAPDWQRIACALAARQRFAIITGGPGTGKTTTVVRLLALLQAQTFAQQQSPLRIALTAPTGKAAARLNESIGGQVEDLDLSGLPGSDRLRDHIPDQVTTLHRLLGARPDSRHFRHHRGNPLHLDLLVVDEASMVDVEMMSRLLEALPPTARVILLGDKDQLASVEAGAVLGNLCQRAEQAFYQPQVATWVQAVTGGRIPDHLQDAGGRPLDQAVTMLRVSHRFGADSGIGQLARAVNQGDGKKAAEHLQQAGKTSDIEWPQALGRDTTALLDWWVGKLQPTLAWQTEHQPAPDADRATFDEWARTVLSRLGDFQLLCAVRSGPQGVDQLNQHLTRALHQAGLVQAEHGWFAGRPVMVTRNDYSLGLMNGDIGMTLYGPTLGGTGDGYQLRVAFPASDGSDSIHWVLPSRLQAVETVYAMTVHKSQGSEFSHTALVLPARRSPVLTRELVYTGITRARARFSLIAGEAGLFREAVSTQVRRVSGLVL
ncbi:MAG: exodeoxyribonuclease V subunit alpha [Natronospirillum sp.]|uniref:exodeoxyribonuclease V subunit alpha n=1 Tax=Natronospirillum sp. TaxID=2812955 RepID=UPI0025E76172|nr:exodeoxyribonuclease V subunit alpha [Natronospirillum sp.]MCH8552658.1 exodeoxyribonuclease V subunit alpha [Natronospirillum sp.]